MLQENSKATRGLPLLDPLLQEEALYSGQAGLMAVGRQEGISEGLGWGGAIGPRFHPEAAREGRSVAVSVLTQR